MPGRPASTSGRHAAPLGAESARPAARAGQRRQVSCADWPRRLASPTTFRSRLPRQSRSASRQAPTAAPTATSFRTSVAHPPGETDGDAAARDSDRVNLGIQLDQREPSAAVNHDGELAGKPLDDPHRGLDLSASAAASTWSIGSRPASGEMIVRRVSGPARPAAASCSTSTGCDRSDAADLQIAPAGNVEQSVPAGSRRRGDSLQLPGGKPAERRMKPGQQTIPGRHRVQYVGTPAAFWQDAAP